MESVTLKADLPLSSESRQNQSLAGARSSTLPLLGAQGGLLGLLGGWRGGEVRLLSVTPAAVIVTQVPIWLPGRTRGHFPLGIREAGWRCTEEARGPSWQGLVAYPGRRGTGLTRKTREMICRIHFIFEGIRGDPGI